MRRADLTALRRRAAVVVLAGAGLLAAGCASAHPYAPVPQPVVATAPSANATPIDQVGLPRSPPLPPMTTLPPGPAPYPVGEVYAGLGATALPSLGVTLEGGQIFTRTRLANWSFELRLTYQDLGFDPFGQNEAGGTWGQVQGGLKAEFLPCGRWHPTLRAGLGWFRNTQRTDLVEEPGDYPHLYVGAGIEFDVTRRITTGPEFSLLMASQEKEFDPIYVPQVTWHLLIRF